MARSAYAMLQWACARIGAILVTLNPAYRVHELIATLSLAQVNHLFLVPRIRSSAYLRILSAALPALTSTPAGSLNLGELPDLRNVVVVDDMGGGASWQEEIAHVKSAVDFREILVWREDGSEQRNVKELEASLGEHEVINLQFTRYVLLPKRKIMCSSCGPGMDSYVPLSVFTSGLRLQYPRIYRCFLGMGTEQIVGHNAKLQMEPLYAANFRWTTNMLGRRDSV